MSAALSALKSDRKAGGLVYRETKRGGRLCHEVLVVTSRSNPDRWILPKGSAESGESAEMTASREIEEEAGVRGSLVAELGVVRRPAQTIVYFLFACTAELPSWDDAEHRERRWIPLDEAERHIRQADLHGIVDRARRRLRRG
jgi:8-oxo-dGTP pyrophosphatase MutT (NUDIX family)